MRLLYVNIGFYEDREDDGVILLLGPLTEKEILKTYKRFLKMSASISSGTYVDPEITKILAKRL